MNIHIAWKKKLDSALFHAKALENALGNMKANVSTAQWKAAIKLHTELKLINDKINWTQEDK